MVCELLASAFLESLLEIKIHETYLKYLSVGTRESPGFSRILMHAKAGEAYP